MLQMWITQHPVLFGLIIGIVAVWTAIWKALGLWKSARKNHVVWFIVFCVVNLLGILEILYLFVFSKIGEKPTKKRK